MQEKEILDYPEWKHQRPRLYSKEAVLGFTVLFTILFGAILYIANLRTIGKWHKGFFVTVGAVFYHLVAMEIIQRFEIPFIITFIVNFIGGIILVGPVWNKQINQKLDYVNRSLLTPFLIAVIIVLLVIIAQIRFGMIDIQL